jgi:hypothetical protein
MTRLRLRRVFWIGAATILVVAALVALAAIVKGDFSETDGRILLTLAAVLYTGGAALAGLALVDRGTARRLGWIIAGAAPGGLALMAWGVWSFVFEGGNELPSKLAWSAVIALAAGLIATTSLLLTRRITLVRLAIAAGAVSALAAALSIVGIWVEPDSDAFVKALAVLWILAALAYFLVPVLQRFTAAGAPPAEVEVRVLALLGDVELVASRWPVEGVAVEERPRPGEALMLRRRPDA